MPNYISQFNLIKKILGINGVASIRFSDRKLDYYRQYKDTVCTALARVLKTKTQVFIDRKYGQLCPGGNYFLNITKYSEKEICDTYVKDEKIFNNNTACFSFLKKMSKCPEQKKRYILFSPLEKEVKKPDIIILLLNPSQAGRILGLSVFKKMGCPNVIPASPTCFSIYAPLISNQMHLNFIDYYDRYYQGKQNGKSIWDDGEMLVSLTFSMFSNIIKSIHLSPHGLHKTNLKPQSVSEIFHIGSARDRGKN